MINSTIWSQRLRGRAGSWEEKPCSDRRHAEEGSKQAGGFRVMRRNGPKLERKVPLREAEEQSESRIVTSRLKDAAT